MDKQKIKRIAKEISQLEKECEQGINISENIKRMETLMSELPFDELLELNFEIEQNFLT